MSAPTRRTRAAAVLAGALMLAGLGKTERPPAAPSTAVRCWIAGETEGALAALDAAPPGRERDLNRAVVRLYAGEAARAETELGALCHREPRWTPAMRWLARAQRELGRPALVDTARALLRMPGANGRDHFWAGRLFLERGDLQDARACFIRAVHDEEGLDLAWLDLAETEARLGHADAASKARDRAGALRAAERVQEAAPPADTATPGPVDAPPAPLRRERLRYRAKYLFFHLATLTVESGEPVLHAGRPAHKVVLTAKSNPGIFFFHMDSRFESVIGEDGVVLSHRHVTDDSNTGADAAGYDMDRDAARCTVRSVAEGLFAYDVLPLPPNAQDGVSVLLLARALVRTKGSIEVPTAIDDTWKTTRLRAVGQERIRWHGHEARTVRVQSLGRYQGPAGVSGVVDIWVSEDERAVPYRVRMKGAVGSVGLELLPEDRTNDDAGDTAF